MKIKMLNSEKLYIGIMSGTSMDGADAVLICMKHNQWHAALAHTFMPFSNSLKADLLALQNVGHNELHLSHILAIDLANIYTQLVEKLLKKVNLQPENITAIGCHGQTIRHAPECGYSIQICDWARLAQQTSILTIGNFRTGDLAAGGQGAPLVPAFHQAVFSHCTEMRVVLNIGGIANISVLPPNGGAAFGFDTGAGNMLMDAWTQEIWSQPYDTNGELAQQGTLLPELLTALCNHAYFRLPYPKSTGRELFSLSWLKTHLHGHEKPHDVLRTLAAFSSKTIVDAIIQAAPQSKNVFVCGGGIKNTTLMHCLTEDLAKYGLHWHSTESLHLNPQWVEAAAFGWLASCWIEKIPSNPKYATGAIRDVALGAGYLP